MSQKVPAPKFLLDENISKRIYDSLKNKKFDVESVQTLEISGIKNTNLIKKAIKLKRILITHDKHFLKIKNKSHFGIIILDIHPPIDSFVLPVLINFIESPNFQNLNIKNSLIILQKDSYEII